MKFPLHFFPREGNFENFFHRQKLKPGVFFQALVTSEELSGALDATLGYAYNDDFNLQAVTYAGGTESYSYDNDGLLTGAGRFTITRNAENSLPESVTGGAFALSRTYNGYGETEAQSVGVAGQGVCSWNLAFDKTGRITGKTETVNGIVVNYAFTYDPMGRLLTVTKDGSLIEEYRYNANGSRIYEMNAQRGIAGRDLTYSDEDHLLTAGGITYQYNPDGFLRTRTDGQNVTTYDYSSRGELYSVTLPDGTFVEYVHDPLGRPIAKKVNGAIVEKYLWSGMTRLMAVYDGSGTLKMRFEYADSRVPYAMNRNGTVYFLNYDQVGSLRAVADSSGNLVKEINYDSFGNIIADNNPSFDIPFGFAGGLQDRDIMFVRFGFRDYDSETGRWTAKDPIMFAGGDTDLYGYCLNDPVNWGDFLGLIKIKGVGPDPIYVHPNDPDPKPSDPHGHIGSPNSTKKVDVNTGEVYDGTQKTDKKLNKKQLEILRNLLKAKNLLQLNNPVIIFDWQIEMLENGWFDPTIPVDACGKPIS